MLVQKSQNFKFHVSFFDSILSFYYKSIYLSINFLFYYFIDKFKKFKVIYLKKSFINVILFLFQLHFMYYIPPNSPQNSERLVTGYIKTLYSSRVSISV